jgi:curli biogenesis system outer membrane secretion channel CsgG
MKSRVCWTLLFILAVVATAPAFAQGGLRYTITVSKFENRQGWRWWGTDIGDAWGTVMTDMLNQSGQFIVLGETDMRNEALAEQDFAASGRTAQGSKAPVIGQMTPAQLLVKGNITHFQAATKGGGGGVRVKGFRVGGKKSTAEINATIYVVDSTTGQIMASKSVEATSKSRGGTFGYSGSDFGGDVGGFKNDNVGKAMEAAISEAVDFIISQLDTIPWTGSVAMVKDGKVYVNRGTREGVNSGQTFSVGTVDVIRDPETGEKLDESLNEVATLRVDSVKEKLSICSVTSGGGVERGMTVFPN